MNFRFLSSCAALGLLTTSSGIAQTIQYTAGGFEGPTFVPGVLADDTLNQFGGTGQDDWIVTGSQGQAVDFAGIHVQTQTVHSGAQAVTLDAASQNADSLHLRRNTQFVMPQSAETVLDVRMNLRLEPSANPSEAWAFQAQAGPGPGSGIYSWDVHPDGRIRYANDLGQEIDTGFTLSRGLWYEVVTSVDYAAQSVTLTIDGIEVAEFPGLSGIQFGFFAFASVALFEPGDDQLHIDDFELISRPADTLGSQVGSPYCGPAVANSTGQPSELRAFGSTVAADDDLTLRATQLPPNQFAMMIVGTSSGLTPMPGGSQGNLCLSGSVGRYNGAGQLRFSGISGEVTLALDLTQTPTATGPTPILAGQTWYFQCWYRDQNPGPASNFTNGVMVAFQ